jgi:hypothetical protein
MEASMRFFALITLFAFALQEKETAEQFLKKVEEKYSKAKSLKWKGEGKAEGLGELTYEIQVKGAKFNIAATMTDMRHGDTQKKAAICDGANIVGEGGTVKAPEGAAKDFVSRLLKLDRSSPSCSSSRNRARRSRARTSPSAPRRRSAAGPRRRSPRR